MLDKFGISPSGLKSKAKVRNGAVLLGKYFTCDDHFERPVRVVTHAHSDHIGGLRKSLASCDLVVMTELTRGFLRTLYGERFGSLDDVLTLEYGETLEFEGEKLTFFDAGHIPGSAQVQVETQEGEKLLYTGDVKLPGAPVISAELLVIEATYGKPSHARFFQGEIEGIFAEFVRDRLREGSVNIKAFHGKIQEVLKILRRKGIETPAVMPRRVYEVSKLCKEAGNDLGVIHPLDGKQGRNVLSKRHIGLYHSRGKVAKDCPTEIRLSGWMFSRPITRTNDGYIVGLSDHCDFNYLLEYVRECDPDYVIVDGSQGGSAETFASQIRKRIKKPAVSMR